MDILVDNAPIREPNANSLRTKNSILLFPEANINYNKIPPIYFMSAESSLGTISKNTTSLVFL